jgi:hypothetical protein
MIRIILFAICLISFVFIANGQAPGTSACGAMQRIVQTSVGDENPTKYKNHGAYVSAVDKLVSQGVSAGLITKECSECIVSQFAQGIPIANQRPCGTVTQPTQACSETNVTPDQIQTATVLGLQTLDDAWGNAPQFQQLLDSTNSLLGCKIQSESTAGSTQTSPATPLQSSCAASGVNYCGPGTSLTNSALRFINVPPCLNEGCCGHDNCYGKNCVSGDCQWTPQSQSCDDALVSICRGTSSCSPLTILTSPTAIFVCSLVECLNGTFPSTNCVSLRVARVLANPQCLQPASLATCGLACAGQTCSTFTTCNPGSGCAFPVCGSLAEGGGACVEGTTACSGLTNCTSSADCSGGLCLVNTCCGRPVCVNASAFCPDIGNTNRSTLPVGGMSVNGSTIGRP